ncbi:Sugar phosphate permease [Saccharopolyspora antimicrobica]|uniref:Sugar phosphate permease n=1 Tax=Saccharopolyspora antimicrobica TaxID=455193 RepID=A0A1I4RKC3_9PSEU|nr:MFS transporter [Saccharopolyspora antimicrobica]RKT87976.1 sugar phosphate permease [Saccharopolyspora antimicrobica]SFM52695.1 Sugar phosphate permease [Saccharopolyspora antimicrobica]
MSGTATAPHPAGARAEHSTSSRTAWLVWGIGAICYCAALFHRASLGVAAPEALQRFAIGPAMLSLFSALQLGIYLALQVPSGLLADRLGPRKVITGGMVALAAGSAVFAVSGSIVGGIAGRMLIGFGDAFMFTNVLRLAAHWFPPHKFGKVAAITGLAGGLGQIVSTLPLGLALHSIGWVPTFAGAAVLTAGLAVVAALAIRDRPDHAAVAGAPAPAPERIAHTLRHVIAQRGTKHSFWVHFVLMAQFVAVTTLWGGPWLTESQGHGQAEVGSLLLISVVGFIAGSWFSGQFISGDPVRRDRFSLGLSCAVVAVWALLVAWPGVLPMPLLVAALVIIGVGGGAAMLAFDGARMANAEHRSGTASGVVNMGGFSAAVLVQLLVGGVLQFVSFLPAVQAYRWAFAPVLVLLAVGTAAQWLLRDRR